MIIICEECGKKYQIDPAKITGLEAKAKCQACGHVITVSKPKPQATENVANPPFSQEPVVEREPPSETSQGDDAAQKTQRLIN